MVLRFGKKKYILATIILTITTNIGLTGQEMSDSVLNVEPLILRQIEEKGVVTVVVPQELKRFLTSSETDASSESKTVEKPSVSKQNTRVGYRVQVYDDNNVRTAKSQAQERKAMIERRFPELQTYIQFNSPYWKVKVGDFRTHSEAEAAMEAIRTVFPSISSQLRIVRDRINTN